MRTFRTEADKLNMDLLSLHDAARRFEFQNRIIYEAVDSGAIRVVVRTTKSAFVNFVNVQKYLTERTESILRNRDDSEFITLREAQHEFGLKKWVISYATAKMPNDEGGIATIYRNDHRYAKLGDLRRFVLWHIANRPSYGEPVDA